ncbi:MAG TPA: response regulator [Kofleriaceae bacterium]
MDTALSILIVDDELDIAELLAELLSTRGHNVTTATNGALAQALLASHDFDLVITDLMMPIVSGVELVRSMRALPRLAAVPVIMISAQRDIATISAGLVQATLQKPFSPRALYAAMDRVTAGPS